MVQQKYYAHLTYACKSLRRIRNHTDRVFSVVESGEREPVVLTHEQAEMLEKWSALRPEQKEAVVHLLSTMP